MLGQKIPPVNKTGSAKIKLSWTYPNHTHLFKMLTNMPNKYIYHDYSKSYKKYITQQLFTSSSQWGKRWMLRELQKEIQY